MDKEEISKLREIPLDVIMENFSAKRDPADPMNNWKSHAGRITITDNKFYNHTLTKGGLGAIDLTMHLGDFDFKEAISWLGGNIGREATIVQYRNEAEKQVDTIIKNVPKPKLPIPEADQSKLSHVITYLTEKRAIPKEIIDNAINKNHIWADKYANAVFSLHDINGNKIGVEVRGTYDKPFYGVRGEKGLFFTGTSQNKIAVFVESSIEALSYQAMNRDSLVIGTVGNSREIMSEVAKSLENKGYKIIDGFNKDTEGDNHGIRLQESIEQKIEKRRPQNGKDWNIELQFYKEANLVQERA